MKLELPFPAKNIYIINPEGDVAIISCWTKPEKLMEEFTKAKTPFVGCLDRVAAIGTLYGGGFSNLIRNLAYNPQITTVIVTGRDRSGSGKDLDLFYKYRASLVETSLGPRYKILTSERLIDDDCGQVKLDTPPDVIYLADRYLKEGIEPVVVAIKAAPHELPASNRQSWTVPKPPPVLLLESNITEHRVIATDPYDAYTKAVQKVATFGKRTKLKKGDRIELQNLVVVVRKPQFTEEVLRNFSALSPSFNWDAFHKYYVDTFVDKDPHGLAYTYGSRLGNAIDEFEKRLTEDVNDRHCLWPLWRPEDVTAPSGPCLDSIFVRVEEPNLDLNLTATFRTHNMMTAWPSNIFALSKIQERICRTLSFKPGVLTVISRSISISPEELKNAKQIADSIKYKFQPDSIGNFIIETIDDKIHVRLVQQDREVLEFSADRAEKLHYQILSKGILSDASHALYLGRMLQKAEDCIKAGIDFVQE